jgi:hypothetical protein
VSAVVSLVEHMGTDHKVVHCSEIIPSVKSGSKDYVMVFTKARRSPTCTFGRAACSDVQFYIRT